MHDFDKERQCVTWYIEYINECLGNRVGYTQYEAYTEQEAVLLFERNHRSFCKIQIVSTKGNNHVRR